MASRIKEAINIIKNNDRGGYTVPTNRLYPYQWNWDSGFTALGIWHFNKWRAWLEITSLLDAQWEDGMVPHIVFRRNDPDYFPGPDVWKTNTEPPTSGHSQPPVLASVVLQMVRMGSNYDKKNLTDDQIDKLITDNYNLDFLDIGTSNAAADRAASRESNSGA